MARPWSLLHLHHSEGGGATFFFTLKVHLHKWFDFLVGPPICTVCVGVGSFPSFQPAYSPQHATLRVVCSRDLFSPLLFAPPRLVLSALPSLYTPLRGRHCIFSVNWDEVKLSSFCFWPKEEVPEICHQPPWKKGNLSYLLLVV